MNTGNLAKTLAVIRDFKVNKYGGGRARRNGDNSFIVKSFFTENQLKKEKFGISRVILPSFVSLLYLILYQRLLEELRHKIDRIIL